MQLLQDMQLSQNCNVDMQLFHTIPTLQYATIPNLQSCNKDIAYPLGFGTKPLGARQEKHSTSWTSACRRILGGDSENTVAFSHQTWLAGKSTIHWIGLRENLQETMVFTIKYRAFL